MAHETVQDFVESQEIYDIVLGLENVAYKQTKEANDLRVYQGNWKKRNIETWAETCKLLGYIAELIDAYEAECVEWVMELFDSYGVTPPTNWRVDVDVALGQIDELHSEIEKVRDHLSEQMNTLDDIYSTLDGYQDGYDTDVDFDDVRYLYSYVWGEVERCIDKYAASEELDIDI